MADSVHLYGVNTSHHSLAKKAKAQWKESTGRLSEWMRDALLVKLLPLLVQATTGDLAAIHRFLTRSEPLPEPQQALRPARVASKNPPWPRWAQGGLEQTWRASYFVASARAPVTGTTGESITKVNCACNPP